MKPKTINKKLRVAMTSHVSGFQPVSDNWYPNYEGDLISFALTEQASDHYFRISFWGDDDFGMEKSFTIDKESRLDLLLSLKFFLRTMPNKISQNWLKDQGFERA